MIVLLLGMTLNTFAASEIRILSECDEAAEVRAHVAKDAPVEVRSSISAGSPCYSVSAAIDGKQINGYVIDDGLDAVAAFEKAKNQSLRDALSAPPVVPAPPPAPPAPASAPDAKAGAAESSSVGAAAAPKEAPKSKPIIPD
jgi:hypothetical protein